MTNEEFQTLVLQQLQSLNKGLKSLDEKQKSLTEEQKSLAENQKSLAEGQSRIENRMDKLELRMENEIIEKIGALFDDRSINQDYFSSIKDSLARLEGNVEYLTRQNIEHRTKLHEHDRELRLLRIEKT